MTQQATPNLALPYWQGGDPADGATQQQALAQALDTLLANKLNAPGDLKTSARPGAQTGWLVCDGALVSRATYAALFSAIGTAFGVGDGSTTFALPDYRGRTLVGAGQGAGLSARALGSTGGEETHVLSKAEMPVHNHTGTSGSMNRSNPHSHQYSRYTANLAGYNIGTAATQFNYGAWTTNTTDINHEHSIPNDGSGAPANNMQPFATATVLIKT